MEVYIILVVSVILLMFRFYFKISIKHKYQKDKLIQKEVDGKKESLLYKLSNLVDPITRKYVSRYTILTEDKQKSCIVLYDSPKEMIKYNLYLYNKKNKLIDVLEIKEEHSEDTSKYIALNKKVKKVNIKVIQVDNVTLNKPLKKVPFLKLFIYTIFTFIFIFFSLFLLTNLLFTVTRDFVVTSSLSFSIIYSFIMLIYLMRKNRMEDDL